MQAQRQMVAYAPRCVYRVLHLGSLGAVVHIPRLSPARLFHQRSLRTRRICRLSCQWLARRPFSSQIPTSGDTCSRKVDSLRQCFEQGKWGELVDGLASAKKSEGNSLMKHLFLSCLQTCSVHSIASFFQQEAEMPDRLDDILSSVESDVLQEVVRAKRNELLLLLLEYFDVNVLNSRGETAVHVAILSNNTEALQLLLEQGADSSPIEIGVDHSLIRIAESNQALRLPLLALATAVGNVRAVDFLLAHDVASLESIHLSSIGNLLHLAIRSAHFAMLKHMLKNYKEAMVPLLEQQDGQGRTPLALAAFLGDLPSIELLHGYGASFEAESSQGLKALEWAVIGNRRQAILTLYRLGASFSRISERLHALPPIQRSPIRSTIRGLVKSLAARGKTTVFSRRGFTEFAPENVVVMGGGAKALCQLGALCELSDQGCLSRTKRVAGTSMGAIIASLLAVGYSPHELADTVMEMPLASMLETSEGLQEEMDRLIRKGVIADLGRVRTLAIAHPIQAASIARKILRELQSSQGICSSQPLHDWLEERIALKTSVPNFTLGELADRIASGQGSYLHCSVYATQLIPKQEVLCITSEESEWREATLASAASASALYPFVFQPSLLLFKSSVGTYHDPQARKLIDGGLLRNLPINRWDLRGYVSADCAPSEANIPTYNPATLAISLFSSSKEEGETVVDELSLSGLIGAITKVYLNAEQLLSPSFDQHRQIRVDTGNVGTFEVDVSSQEWDKLLKRGAKAARAFILAREDISATLRIKKSLGKAISPPFCLPQAPTSFVQPPPVLFSSIASSLGMDLPSMDAARPAVRIHKIAGMPGSGKSVLAAAFARHCRERVSLVHWIDCSSEATRGKSFRDLGKALYQLDAELPVDEVERQVLRALENHPFSKPWLLVYDHVATPVNYPKQGGFIVTTTNGLFFGGRSRGTWVPDAYTGEIWAKYALHALSGTESLLTEALKTKQLGAVPVDIAKTHWTPALGDLKDHHPAAYQTLLVLAYIYSTTESAASEEGESIDSTPAFSSEMFNKWIEYLGNTEAGRDVTVRDVLDPLESYDLLAVDREIAESIALRPQIPAVISTLLIHGGLAVEGGVGNMVAAFVSQLLPSQPDWEKLPRMNSVYEQEVRKLANLVLMKDGQLRCSADWRVKLALGLMNLGWSAFDFYAEASIEGKKWDREELRLVSEGLLGIQVLQNQDDFQGLASLWNLNGWLISKLVLNPQVASSLEHDHLLDKSGRRMIKRIFSYGVGVDTYCWAVHRVLEEQSTTDKESDPAACEYLRMAVDMMSAANSSRFNLLSRLHLRRVKQLSLLAKKVAGSSQLQSELRALLNLVYKVLGEQVVQTLHHNRSGLESSIEGFFEAKTSRGKATIADVKTIAYFHHAMAESYEESGEYLEAFAHYARNHYLTEIANHLYLMSPPVSPSGSPGCAMIDFVAPYWNENAEARINAACRCMIRHREITRSSAATFRSLLTDSPSQNFYELLEKYLANPSTYLETYTSEMKSRANAIGWGWASVGVVSLAIYFAIETLVGLNKTSLDKAEPTRDSKSE